jgi:hypothetical protein
MEKGRQLNTGVWQQVKKWPGPDQEKLDRVLVAGLLLETILDAPDSLDNDQSRRRAIKARLKHNLATHLAGRVTLDHFRALIRNLDHWFPYYYPLVAPVGYESGGGQGVAGVTSLPEAPRPASCCVLKEAELEEWLAAHVHEVLPQRPHRKLHPAMLPEFLRCTRGGWFRIRDFEAHFGIDRKTAWEYLRKLRAAGLLCHNGERSAAVRYCLGDRFLLVRAAALRQKTRETLGDEPVTLAPQLADRLIASGGEAFWEDRWGELLTDPERRKTIISRLVAAGVLRLVAQSGRNRMVRLSPPWLQK